MELILHIGANRTASTAMQDMFAANRATVQGRGIKALVHAQLGAKGGFPGVVHHKYWDQARVWLEAQIQGAQKVITFVEGMIAGKRGGFKAAEIVVWPVEAEIPPSHLGGRLLNEDDPILTPPPAGVKSALNIGIIPALEKNRTAHPAAPCEKICTWIKTQKPTEYQGGGGATSKVRK